MRANDAEIDQWLDNLGVASFHGKEIGSLPQWFAMVLLGLVQLIGSCIGLSR